MNVSVVLATAIFLGGCATMQLGGSQVSILVDLDPGRADRSVIVESITADAQGRLYLPDRVSGNILRVDPKSPKPVVVGQIGSREIKGKKVRANAAIVFVGDTGYMSNFDRPRRDNMDADGKTAMDGIGASIAQITF